MRILLLYIFVVSANIVFSPPANAAKPPQISPPSVCAGTLGSGDRVMAVKLAWDGNLIDGYAVNDQPLIVTGKSLASDEGAVFFRAGANRQVVLDDTPTPGVSSRITEHRHGHQIFGQVNCVSRPIAARCTAPFGQG